MDVSCKHDFTIAILPDTQNYSERMPDYFHAQTKWIAENAERERIIFVSHMGDLVAHGAARPAEWEVAVSAMDRLDGVVPFGVTIGNCDYDRQGSGPERFTAHSFLRAFGPKRLGRYPWYGGATVNGLNSYQLFEAGETLFIALNLEIDVPDAAVRWAQDVLDRYPKRLAIVTTHIYLDPQGRRLNVTPFGPMRARLEGLPVTGAVNSAESLWRRLIRRNPQVVAVLCGHHSRLIHQVSRNDAAEPTFEIMSNFQDGHNGGDGWMRLMRFDLLEQRLCIETFSPTLNTFATDGESRLDFHVDLMRRIDVVSRGVRVYNPASGYWEYRLGQA